MADPVIVRVPAVVTSASAVSADTSAFNNKLTATDNLLQEIADALDDHTHKIAELTEFKAPNDNLTDLGAADKRWKDIYAGNAVIQTSDRNYKTDVEMMGVGDCWSFVDALSPVTFRFNDGKRTHTGFIAQEVRDSFRRANKDFAIFVEQQGVCGLRYEEAIAPIVGCLQDLQDTDMCLGREIEVLRGDILEQVPRIDAALAQMQLHRTEDEYMAKVLGQREAETEAHIRILQQQIELLKNGNAYVKQDLEARIIEVAARKVDEPETPTNWLGWAAVGLSVISILLRFV
jgi:hypothetical protein